MKKTTVTNMHTEPNAMAMMDVTATLPPLPSDVLLWADFQFEREIANGRTTIDNTPTFSGKGEPGMLIPLIKQGTARVILRNSR